MLMFPSLIYWSLPCCSSNCLSSYHKQVITVFSRSCAKEEFPVLCVFFVWFVLFIYVTQIINMQTGLTEIHYEMCYSTKRQSHYRLFKDLFDVWHHVLSVNLRVIVAQKVTCTLTGFRFWSCGLW